MTLLEVDEAANAISDQVDRTPTSSSRASIRHWTARFAFSVSPPALTALDRRYRAEAGFERPSPTRRRCGSNEPVAATPLSQAGGYRPAAQRPLIEEPAAQGRTGTGCDPNRPRKSRRPEDRGRCGLPGRSPPRQDAADAPVGTRLGFRDPARAGTGAARAELNPDDAPLFPDRHFGDERPKGGFFRPVRGGTRRHDAPPPPPLKDYQ